MTSDYFLDPFSLFFSKLLLPLIEIEICMSFFIDVYNVSFLSERRGGRGFAEVSTCAQLGLIRILRVVALTRRHHSQMPRGSYHTHFATEFLNSKFFAVLSKPPREPQRCKRNSFVEKLQFALCQSTGHRAERFQSRRFNAAQQ